MSGRSAGAEATQRAVVASMTAQIPTLNFVPLLKPYERRMQAHIKLNMAIAKRN
jgi:hypothetical protein